MAWSDLCFQGQGRARLIQGNEKNLMQFESYFWRNEKRWGVALSAPVYGEKTILTSWLKGVPQVEKSDLETVHWNPKDKEGLHQLMILVASVLESSISGQCILKAMTDGDSGECPAPLKGLDAFQYQMHDNQLQFIYTTEQNQKVVWGHSIGESKKTKQIISLYSPRSESSNPLWSLELFVSRCE